MSSVVLKLLATAFSHGDLKPKINDSNEIDSKFNTFVESFNFLVNQKFLDKLPALITNEEQVDAKSAFKAKPKLPQFGAAQSYQELLPKLNIDCELLSK